MRHFTAAFKHSQYILRKAIMAFAMNVNQSIAAKVKI
jgi:hypothetical protein